MTEWTIDSLRKLDRRFAEEGVPPHARPVRAVLEILRQHGAIDFYGNPEAKRIEEAYEAMNPDVRAIWPGMGIGLAAVVDQVRRVTVPVVFGRVTVPTWRGLGFTNEREWRAWCREDHELAAQTVLTFADILDLTYGLNAIRGSNGPDLPMWRLAASSLSDCANTLPMASSVDSVTQSIFMTVELFLKAALVRNGAHPDSFQPRSKGEGHDVVKLAKRLARESPHRDDARVAGVAASLPAYVESRYSPKGLTRLEVTTLALGAQFVAASAVRRYSNRDFAAKLDCREWPPLLRK